MEKVEAKETRDDVCGEAGDRGESISGVDGDERESSGRFVAPS